MFSIVFTLRVTRLLQRVRRRAMDRIIPCDLESSVKLLYKGEELCSHSIWYI